MCSAICVPCRRKYLRTKSHAHAGAFSIKTPPKHQQSEDGVTDPHSTWRKIKFLPPKKDAEKTKEIYIFTCTIATYCIWTERTYITSLTIHKYFMF